MLWRSGVFPKTAVLCPILLQSRRSDISAFGCIEFRVRTIARWSARPHATKVEISAANTTTTPANAFALSSNVAAEQQRLQVEQDDQASCDKTVTSRGLRKVSRQLEVSRQLVCFARKSGRRLTDIRYCAATSRATVPDPIRWIGPPICHC